MRFIHQEVDKIEAVVCSENVITGSSDVIRRMSSAKQINTAHGGSRSRGGYQAECSTVYVQGPNLEDSLL